MNAHDDTGSSSPSAGPEGAVRHRAPPPDERPRSKLATWAFLGALGASGAAFAFHLFWPLVVPALAFAIWAALRIKPREERGQGLVFLAILLTLLIGGFSFVGTLTMLDMTEHLATGVLSAAASEGTPEERTERVVGWLTEIATEGGAAERLLQRFDAAVAAVGPWGGEVVIPSSLLGLNGIRRVPKGVADREIGSGIGDAWVEHRDAVWVKARFRDAELWVELVLGEAPFEEQKRQVEELRKDQASRLLADVRLFRVH